MIAGEVAPSLALSLIQRLPDDSLTVALANGGRSHFGWGTDRHLLADLYDALNTNTRATGNWKDGKAPKLPEWPRPGGKADEAAQKPATVASLHARFSGMR